MLTIAGCADTTGSVAVKGGSPDATEFASPPSATFPSTTVPGSGDATPNVVRDYINQFASGDHPPFREWGGTDAAGNVTMTLRADQAPLAKDLHARFGDRVRVRLGFFAYPLGSSATPVCPAFPELITKADGLQTSLKLQPETVVAGADFAGTVTITNTGDQSVKFAGGEPLSAVIRQSGTTHVVGIYDGQIGGVGIEETLAPGRSREIQVLGGTASCDPSLGFALPAGNYDVVVNVLGPKVSGPNSSPLLSAGPVLLSVIAKAP